MLFLSLQQFCLFFVFCFVITQLLFLWEHKKKPFFQGVFSFLFFISFNCKYALNLNPISQLYIWLLVWWCDCKSSGGYFINKLWAHITHLLSASELSSLTLTVAIFSFYVLKAALPFIIMTIVFKPYQRGVYCDDESIKYPLKADTITHSMLAAVTISCTVVIVRFSAPNAFVLPVDCRQTRSHSRFLRSHPEKPIWCTAKGFTPIPTSTSTWPPSTRLWAPSCSEPRLASR